MVVDGARNGAGGAHEFFAQGVEFGRRHARFHERRDVVERVGGDAAGRSHADETFFVVQGDFLAVFKLGGIAHGFLLG
ncbi:hypothetical protein D3C84_1267550 [compost metagenome]